MSVVFVFLAPKLTPRASRIFFGVFVHGGFVPLTEPWFVKLFRKACTPGRWRIVLVSIRLALPWFWPSSFSFPSGVASSAMLILAILPLAIHRFTTTCAAFIISFAQGSLSAYPLNLRFELFGNRSLIFWLFISSRRRRKRHLGSQEYLA